MARQARLATSEQKVLQSLRVVCLRLCLMVATWLQFSKWPVLHPDVNTANPMVLKHASVYQNNPKQT